MALVLLNELPSDFWTITLGEALNFIALVITAFIVWRYTKAAQKSNEIQERPVLNLYLREEEAGGNTRYSLGLRNVGRGPAYNISINSINASGCRYQPYFDESNPILECDGDEKELRFFIKNEDGSTEYYDRRALGFQRFLDRAFPRDSVEQHEARKRNAVVFLIQYDGINGSRYYSIFRLYPKQPPLIGYRELVVEFLGSGKGFCSLDRALTICAKRRTLKSVYDDSTDI